MKHRLIVAVVALLLIGGSLFVYVQSDRPTAPPAETAVLQTNAVAQATDPASPITRAEPQRSPARATATPGATPTSSQDRPPAFAAFAGWADRFLAGDPSANAAQGEALAWKRREAMVELIETDPAKAIALTVPYHWRKDLPGKITRHFEEQVDGRGALNVAIATDFDNRKANILRTAQISGKTYQTFVYGRRTAQVSKTDIPLHGIAITPTTPLNAAPSADSAADPAPPPKLALSPDPIRLLADDEAADLEKKYGQPADQICGVSGKPAGYRQQQTAADIGGEVRRFCGVDHLTLVNDRWRLAESGNGTVALADAGPSLSDDRWTHGPKSVLYMRLNFPDDLSDPISEAGSYSVMNGVNRFFTDTSFNLTALTATVTPLVTVPQTKAWYSTAGPFALLSDARAAARNMGYDTANYDWDIVSFTEVPGYDFGGLAFVHGKGVWLQSPGVKVTAHELGHNYGLFHANFWDTGPSNYVSSIGYGTNVEYGNIFDTMGFGNGQFNAVHKNTLNWLPNYAVHDVVSNGVYRIHAYDRTNRVNGRFYAAKVRKDFQRDYWAEFRVEETFNSWSQNGVLLNGSAWDESGTHLLDMTPDGDVEDAALLIGRTFSDALAGVHITPLARGSTGIEPFMDVQVNFGPFPGNKPPFMKMEIDPTNATPNQLIHFHATASDSDGDTLAYAWTFDDGSFSTNNQPWVAKSWSTSGDHLVRCVVSDMKGGIASVNAVVRVGAASGFRISGVVIDENGDPMEGVRIDNDFLQWYTDSEGFFVIPGVDMDINLESSRYGYSFTNLSPNPIPVIGNVSNLVMIGTRLGEVRLNASTNLVAESPIAPNQLTLTRTGSTNEDLNISLFISGTAAVPADLVFVPPLGTGSNGVVIPAGTNRITFTFTPVNDVTLEETETVSITVMDEPAYFVRPLAETRISILDNDDGPALPLVSVVTQNSLIPETGMDGAIFEFSRTGSLNANLQVFYSVSGTATAGTDYPTLLGTVIIPAGSRSATVEFRPTDDKDVELDETVVVTVSPSGTYSGAGSSATTTIANDDLLVVTIAPTLANVAEPSSSGRFTVKRDGDLTGNLVVYYNLTGTASNGVDYVSPSGAVTIPANQTSAEIVITAIEDALVEGDESVIAALTSNPGYNIGTAGSATLFIRDNEKITVSAIATDPIAGEPGSDLGQFLITRGAATSGNLTVNFIINGTAINGSDYVPLENFVVIPDGSSSVTLDVIAFDDLHLEPLEYVFLTLVPSTNYNLGSEGAVVEIEDDDDSSVPAAGFSFATSSALESLSPGISVSLSETSTVPIMVNYRILSGTASNSDYSLPTGPLVFEPGERAKSISLVNIDDALVEPNETIRLALYDPANATLDGIKIHVYTIIDNDLSAASVSSTGNASETGPVPGNFRISRTGSTNSALTVNYQITGTASAPSDFAPLGTSTTIPAGVNFVDVPVSPVNDGVVELDETVVMTLLTAPGGRIAPPGSATVTLSDNDPNSLPVVSIASTNRPHAVEGGGNGEFVFTRSGSTTGALTLNFTILGSASNGGDYAVLTNGITIPVGQSSVTNTVVPVNDSQIEGEETVTLALDVRDTYRVSFAAFATVTIQDNDQNVRLDASDFEAEESGTDLGAFTFTRFGTTNLPVQAFFTISGTASNGVDYAVLSNSIVIPAGSLTATLPIVPLNDLLVEGPEKVTLTLQANAAYAIVTPSAGTVTIMDDEPTLSIIASVPEAIEGASQPGMFTVLRGGNPDYEFTARLTVSGTAGYGVDYPAFVTNIFFSYGAVAVDLLISPTNELVVEGSETVVATLVPNPAYTTLTPSNAVVTIRDAATNKAPTIDITGSGSPSAKTVFLLGTNVNMILEATVTDDGDTNTVITMTWTNVSGPNTLSFGTPATNNTTVSFTNGGVYVLRFTVDDGVLTNFAEITVVVDTLGLLSQNLLRWPLDQTSGTAVPDASGNGHAGVITGPANWVTNGALGGALNLTGTNNFVRETPDSALLNDVKQFSLALRVKTTTTNTSGGIFTANDGGPGPTFTLATRAGAAYGSATNAIEAALTSNRGQVRRVSASNRTSNDWQHITLTWSNGLPLSMFINGQLDQPQTHMVPLLGTLTNCPQFVVGKGPADISTSWKGFIDDVRLFPRALHAAEVEGLVATNYGPIVEVATNLTVQVVTPVEISGIVTDDGRPNPPGTVITTWSLVSGPLPVNIPDPASVTNTVEFIQAGTYIFRLVADDGQVKIYQDLTVTVVEPTSVSVSPSDGDAAELGPNTGEFTFSRVGDLNFNITIQVAMSGSASNGTDFIFISQTNSITLPIGIDSLVVPLTPFLDHRTEGDETVTYTIITNLAYTVAAGQATVTIHDSPYGMWNIEHFTLEELTDPSLSAEGSDFDHDHLQNFAEYAINRDPKSSETNSFVTTAIEFNPADSKNHITLTYKRRIAPTDVAYEVRVSNDLRTWNSGPSHVQEIDVTDDGNTLTETVKARVVAPWPAAGNTQFISVRVWLKTTGP